MKTALALAAVVSMASAHADEVDFRWSALLFGGRMTANNWGEIVTAPGNVETVRSDLFGLAVARNLGQWPAGLQWEIEGQVVRHFEGQEHWEFNAPVVARWSDFPWNNAVQTGAAFGLGLSYATNPPETEIAVNGGSSQLMTYWMIELSVAAPSSPWSLVGRLHHRSTAFGLFGDAGGSNSLVLGVRRNF